MRRTGPASGCSQASRPSDASTLVSVGGHSGPNHPAGTTGPVGRVASDGAGAVNDLAWPILNISLVLITLTAVALFVRFLVRLGQPEEEPEL